MEAGITVMLMEGAPPYFRADICGVIDLFFDEIRECITVHYNSPPPAQLPAPATHPLDREGGHSLVDDRYRKIGTLAADRNAASAEAAVWADAMPMFAFSSAPTLALAPAQFPDVAAYPEGVRARPLGSDLLSYEWHLLDLQLVDATAADALVAGPLSCAWLDGKAGDAANQPQPAELALLTPKGDLWLHAQGDVPADSDSPLGQRAGICLLSARARPGWALGEGAARDGTHLAAARQPNQRRPDDQPAACPRQPVDRGRHAAAHRCRLGAKPARGVGLHATPRPPHARRAGARSNGSTAGSTPARCCCRQGTSAHASACAPRWTW